MIIIVILGVLAFLGMVIAISIVSGLTIYIARTCRMCRKKEITNENSIGTENAAEQGVAQTVEFTLPSYDAAINKMAPQDELFDDITGRNSQPPFTSVDPPPYSK